MRERERERYCRKKETEREKYRKVVVLQLCNSAVHIVVRILVRVVVLTLCAKTSNPLFATRPTRSKLPLKSGVKHSTRI